MTRQIFSSFVPLVAYSAILLNAQPPAAEVQKVPVTMKQIMVDLIHPASNEILLFVARGGSKDEKDWAPIRHSALTLTESGSSLIARVPGADWERKADLLRTAANEAYQAAQAKDLKSLSNAAASIDAACTSCHKQFRPNVFPRQGGSQ